MFRCLIALFGSVWVLGSCSSDTEDKLYGKWQLLEVIEPDGNVQRVDTVWYNFQTSLFMYQLYQPGVGGEGEYRYCYGYNSVEEDGCLLLELTSYPVPVEKFLPYTDWSSSERTFMIRSLTRSELVLSSEDKRYIFRKF